MFMGYFIQNVFPIHLYQDATPAAQPTTSTSSDEMMARIALNPHKAGMTGVDQAYVNKIIYETSKDSMFFKNEEKKEQRVQEKVVCRMLFIV